MDNTRKGFKLTSTNKDKRIAELEKVCQDLSDKFDYQVKQVMNLEKENAELKARVENQKSFLERIRAKFELGEIDRKEIEGYIKFTSEQLTKAKDLLLKLSTCLEGHSNNNFEYALIKEAEQFLKEVER